MKKVHLTFDILGIFSHFPLLKIRNTVDNLPLLPALSSLSHPIQLFSNKKPEISKLKLFCERKHSFTLCKSIYYAQTHPNPIEKRERKHTFENVKKSHFDSKEKNFCLSLCCTLIKPSLSELLKGKVTIQNFCKDPIQSSAYQPKKF